MPDIASSEGRYWIAISIHSTTNIVTWYKQMDWICLLKMKSNWPDSGRMYRRQH